MIATETQPVRKVLKLDALTCLAAGAAMSLGAGPLSVPLGLDPLLLLIVGCSLFPVAALFAWMAFTPALGRGLLRLAVLGNVAWVAASLAVVVLAQPTALGTAFVTAQALVVAALASIEHRLSQR